MSYIDENNYLLCPGCNFENLHQEWVRAIFRDQEDCDGKIVAVNYKGIVKKRLKNVEIPGRRDVVFIEFWCEDCHKHSILSILQHKGNTIVEWHNIGYKQSAAHE